MIEWMLPLESILLWKVSTAIAFLLSIGTFVIVLIKLRQFSEAPRDGKLISAKATERLLKEIGVTIPDED